MNRHPAALQLRLLQTVVEMAAAELHPRVALPVELLRLLERATPGERPMQAPTTAPSAPVPLNGHRDAERR